MKKLLYLLLLLIPSLVFGQTTINLSPEDSKHNLYVMQTIASAAYETQYQALLDSMTTDPTGDTLTWQNTLVKTLVDSFSTWDALDALWIYAQTDSAEAKWNWVNLAKYNVLPVTDDDAHYPTWDRYEGFTGNVVISGALETFFNPTVETATSNFSLNSASFGTYIRTNNASNAYVDMGLDDGSNDLWLFARNASNQTSIRINDAGSGFVSSVTDARGFYIINRTAADARALYKNGASVYSNSQAATALPNKTIYILARHAAAISGVSPRQSAAAFIGAGLTADQIRVLTNAIEVYMDALGIGVIPESFYLLLLCMIYTRRKQSA